MTHYEDWTLVIQPDAGDEPWPRLQAYERGPFFQPDTLTVKLIRGVGKPGATASGGRVTSAGSVSRARSSKHWYSFEEFPGWAAELITKARAHYGLTADLTGVS